jgi:hypothetical protein
MKSLFDSIVMGDYQAKKRIPVFRLRSVFRVGATRSSCWTSFQPHSKLFAIQQSSITSQPTHLSSQPIRPALKMAGGHGSDSEHVFHPKDALGEAVQAGLTVGVVGTIFSGVQASMTRQNLGAFGALTHYGSTTAIFGTI